jgi:hypothetical protein
MSGSRLSRRSAAHSDVHNCGAVGELILSAIVAVLYWPGLDPKHWRAYPDDLAPAIALLLEVTAIAGVVQALAHLFT